MFKTLMVLAAVLTTALVAVPSGVAARGHIAAVSGTWEATDFGALDCAPIGDSTVLIRCATTGFTSAYGGSLTGSSTVDFTQIIDCVGGFTYGSGVETFSGSVDGAGSGTLSWRIFFYSRFDCATFAVSGFKALAVIQSGTGDLSNVRGTLVFDDVSYRGFLRL